MAITPMLKTTLYAKASEELPLLEAIQTFGWLHLIPLGNENASAKPYTLVTAEAREALNFLLHTPDIRKQTHAYEAFDPGKIKDKTLKLKRRLQDLQEEREFLRHRISTLRPWGDFRLPPSGTLGELRLWFYKAPHHALHTLNSTNLTWQLVGRDHRYAYLVIMAPHEPKECGFERSHTGTQSLSEYKERLEGVENEIEELEIERLSLSRFIDLYAQNLHHLEDHESLERATQNSYQTQGLLVLQGWLPANQEKAFKRKCAELGCALVVSTPQGNDTPPTFLANPSPLSSGSDLVTFYTTPGYHQYDPSGIMLLSFVLFFGIIVGDAGYGALMLVSLVLFWNKMASSALWRRLRILFLLLGLSTAAMGVITGNTFGISPAPGSFMASLWLLNMNDYDAMIRLCIALGALHVISANLLLSRARWLQSGWGAAAAHLGWAVAICGGAIIYLWAPLQVAGVGMITAGLIGVLLYSGYDARGMRRFGLGMAALTRVTSAFGDVLSYLRLFALALATASMAIAFNTMAFEAYDAFPGIGVLFAAIVILTGHGLNLMLGLLGGVVHGLRLNVIEFFNWGLSDEGTPYKPFRKKETHRWSR